MFCYKIILVFVAIISGQVGTGCGYTSKRPNDSTNQWALAPASPFVTDNTYTCSENLNNQFNCTSHSDDFANPDIPPKITINVLLQSGVSLAFFCETNSEKLICTLHLPNSEDSVKLDSWELTLPSSTGFLFFYCKSMDNQLICMAEDKSARKSKAAHPLSVDAITVVVPLSSRVTLLFHCQKNVEDLQCTPNENNTVELDGNDFYEIEVPAKDGPRFYVCQYTDKQLLCKLGKSVFIGDNDAIHTDENIHIKMPKSDGEYDILSCVDRGQELLCHHTTSNSWDGDKEMIYKRVKRKSLMTSKRPNIRNWYCASQPLTSQQLSES